MPFRLFLLLLCGSLQAAVYDCFPFYNELELLDVRLHELDEAVDYFVLVESSVTFRGLPKPYLYEVNKDKFAQFADKIIHVKIGDRGGNAWARENAQRQAIMEGLTRCSDRDIILISDVDEIIPAKKVATFSRMLKRDLKKGFAFKTLQYEFFLNRVSPDRDFPEKFRYFIGPVMLSYQELKKLHPINVRGKRVEGYFTQVQAGWHFTSMGGFARVVEKTNNYSFWNARSDWEDRRPYSEDDIERFWRRVNQCHLVQIDETYPDYIVDHLAYFSDIGFIDQLTYHNPL